MKAITTATSKQLFGSKVEADAAVRRPAQLALLAALLVLPALGCGAPTCPPPPVSLGGAVQSFSFAGPLPVIEGELNGVVRKLLLDTGFDRSAVSSGAARLDLSSVRVRLGEASLGPAPFDVLLSPLGDDVLGNELLHQVPLLIDRAERRVELHPAFAAGADGDVPLDFRPGAGCRAGERDRGALGPFSMTLEAELEGAPATLLLDTGAELTVVRTGRLAELTSRPVLDGVRLSTGFVGLTLASATRARELSVGTAVSPNALVVASADLDRGLDDLAARLSSACGCERRVDGLLGWSFLREFRVDLRPGAGAAEKRALRLTRYASQSHWTRDFVGVGLYYSEVEAGLRVEGFLSRSPAQAAGVRVGDVILTLDGAPAKASTAKLAQGPSVRLRIDRGGAQLELDVPVEDLLPDP